MQDSENKQQPQKLPEKNKLYPNIHFSNYFKSIRKKIDTPTDK